MSILLAAQYNSNVIDEDTTLIACSEFKNISPIVAIDEIRSLIEMEENTDIIWDVLGHAPRYWNASPLNFSDEPFGYEYSKDQEKYEYNDTDSLLNNWNNDYPEANMLIFMNPDGDLAVYCPNKNEPSDFIKNNDFPVVDDYDEVDG